MYKHKKALCYIGSILFLLFFTIVYGFRATKGVCQTDEAFYIALADRIWKGDLLIIEEWHPSQLIGFIIFPFYYVFRTVTGNVEGIVLYCRLLHVIISGIVSVLWFWKFRDRTIVGALLSAVLYLSFSRSSIDGLSYYKVSVTCLVLIIIVLDCLINEKVHVCRKRLYDVILGVLIAYEVLSMPYMMIVVFIVMIYALFGIGCRTKCLLLDFVGVFIGIAIVAFFFMSIAVSWNIETVVSCVKYLFIEPGHDRGVLGTIYDGVYTIYAYGRILPIILGVISLCITWLYRVFSKTKSTCSMFVVCVVCMAVDYIYRFQRDGLCAEEGLQCFDVFLCFLPFIVDCLLDKMRIEAITIILGIALACSYFVGSNTGISAATTGMLVSCMGLTIYTVSRLKRKECNVLIRAALLAELVILVAVATFKHITFVYRDSGLTELNYHINQGVFKGLYTTEIQYDQITKIESSISTINKLEGEQRIIVSLNLPWLYIANNGACASPTSWGVYLDDERITYWNELYPNQRAEKLILVSDDVGGNDFNRQKCRIDEVKGDMSLLQEYSNEYIQVYNIN